MLTRSNAEHEHAAAVLIGQLFECLSHAVFWNHEWTRINTNSKSVPHNSDMLKVLSATLRETTDFLREEQ